MSYQSLVTNMRTVEVSTSLDVQIFLRSLHFTSTASVNRN
jgi:hypothetical protein